MWREGGRIETFPGCAQRGAAEPADRHQPLRLRPPRAADAAGGFCRSGFAGLPRLGRTASGIDVVSSRNTV